MQRYYLALSLTEDVIALWANVIVHTFQTSALAGVKTMASVSKTPKVSLAVNAPMTSPVIDVRTPNKQLFMVEDW